MANRTYDKPETAIKGLVEIPFQFTVNASGVVTAQYPSAATVTIAKDGTTMAGLMNSLMIAVSMGLQYGVPPEVYVSKLSHLRFEPSGLTNDPDIRVAKSLVDLSGRPFPVILLRAHSNSLEHLAPLAVTVLRVCDRAVPGSLTVVGV